MATRIAWLLNFDANVELRCPARYRASETPAWVAQLGALVAPDDLLLDAHFVGPLPPEVTIQTFCPTPSALQHLRKLGLTPPRVPSLDVLRRVNNRQFCAELGQGLPGSAFIRGMAELEAHLTLPSFTGTHVLKRAYSFAGREQRRVKSGLLDPSSRGFAARSFAMGEGLQVEAWVERLGDFSRHGFLTRGGSMVIGPTREQHCDAMGRFRGMSDTAPVLSDDDALRMHEAVCEAGRALLEAGYFGPYGVDGFRYRSPGGGTALQARCEINARITIGYPRGLLQKGLELEAKELACESASANLAQSPVRKPNERDYVLMSAEDV